MPSMTAPLQSQAPAPLAQLPASAPQAPASATDLATMQGRLGELQAQQAGLKAQWNGLRHQLDQMRSDNPARPGVQQQWADVGVHIAQYDGQIAILGAQIAQKQGIAIPGVATVPPRPPIQRSGRFSDAITGMSLLLLIVVAVPISMAWARRIWRGQPAAAAMPIDQSSARFDRLEQSVDAIAIEVERIAEGQRFMTKIMVERPGQTLRDEPAEAATPDAKPVLAIGAGPIEPIRVAERQGVRQSN
jgi:hypothetical protein